MQFLRKATLGLCASLLFSLLLAFGLALGVQRVLGSPDSLKQALKNSNFYGNVVTGALDQVQKNQTQGEGGDQIPLDRPELQNVVKQVATPDLLQTQVEQALDSIYAWLQGKTPTLQFSADLGEFKSRLADGMSGYAKEHLASLPQCTGGQPPADDFDPLSATCLPKGMNVNKAAAQVKDELLHGQFLEDTTINASDLKTEDGKTLEEQLKAAPTAYQAATWSTYGAGALAVLFAVAVLFLSVSRRAGLKKLAIIFIGAGTLTAVLGWLVSYGAERAETMLTDPLQQSAFQAGQFLIGDLRTWWMGYGIGLLVLGVGTLLALYFTRPKAPSAPEKATELAGETFLDKPAKSEPAAPSKPKPPKPPRKLVQ
jgi:hypothetical protein